MIARYSVSAGNYQSAIEFLLMAKRNEEAFQLAQAHREMEHYARSLGDDGTNEECNYCSYTCCRYDIHISMLSLYE